MGKVAVYWWPKKVLFCLTACHSQSGIITEFTAKSQVPIFPHGCDDVTYELQLSFEQILTLQEKPRKGYWFISSPFLEI